MKISVRYFASVREALGRSGETIETSARDLAALRDELAARGGAYAKLYELQLQEEPVEQ